MALILTLICFCVLAYKLGVEEDIKHLEQMKPAA